MLRVKTKSGSEYFIDGNRVLRAVRSSSSASERVGPWRGAAWISSPVVGRPVTIYWGNGVDAQSPEGLEPLGNHRYTVTTEVVSVEEV
jgi:hypothetical protein